MGMYVADLGNNGNYPDDNVRIKINEQFVVPSSEEETETDGVIDQEYIEFLAKDSTFEQLSEGFLDQFTRFLGAFEGTASVSPPVILMSEMLGVSLGQSVAFWNQTTQLMYDKIYSHVMNIEENSAFDYGAQFDNLTEASAEYLHPTGS